MHLVHYTTTASASSHSCSPCAPLPVNRRQMICDWHKMGMCTQGGSCTFQHPRITAEEQRANRFANSRESPPSLRSAVSSGSDQTITPRLALQAVPASSAEGVPPRRLRAMRDNIFTEGVRKGYESCLSMRAGDEFHVIATRSAESSTWLWVRRRVLPPRVGTRQVGYVNARDVVEVGTVVGDVFAGEPVVASSVAVSVPSAPRLPAGLAFSSPQSPSQRSQGHVSPVTWRVWIDGSTDPKRGFACSCVLQVPGSSRELSRETRAVAGFFVGATASELAGLLLSLQILDQQWTEELRARASVAVSVSPALTVTISTDSTKVVEYLGGDQPKTDSGRKLWYMIKVARAARARLQQSGMRIDITWIPREDNGEANKLAQDRMRQARDCDNWDSNLLPGAGIFCFTDEARQAIARTEYGAWITSGNGCDFQHSATRLESFM